MGRVRPLLHYNKNTVFDVKEEHLKLLEEACWEHDDSMYDGAAGMNLKRPYGNSDILRDICRAIGEKPFKDHEGEEHYSEEQYEKAMSLHEELHIVLAIICTTRKVEPGRYISTSDFGHSWKPL